jgi:diphosphomevalonate decarboxylase
MTLSESYTETSVEYKVKKDLRHVSLDFSFGGEPHPVFAEKILKYLQAISPYLPFINSMHLKINTHNSFPHTAGIASSASSFGALSLALCSIEQKLYRSGTNEEEFLKKASFLARLGSGSACRSIYGGYALWGEARHFNGSTNHSAVPINAVVHPVFLDYRNSILIVQSSPKAVTSSEGHQLMDQHPFAEARVMQAVHNLAILMRALTKGDLTRFIKIVEHEALTLHSLMLSSDPGYILFHPNTVKMVNEIRRFRDNTAHPVGFTLDAGANVHVLYPASVEKEVRLFIECDLKHLCENGRVIHDRVGQGPEKISP